MPAAQKNTSRTPYWRRSGAYAVTETLVGLKVDTGIGTGIVIVTNQFASLLTILRLI